MDIDFLGKGWSFAIKLAKNGKIIEKNDPEKNGQIYLTSNQESVRQSIQMILGTAKGERVMRPDFGCEIHDRVFSPNNAGTIGQIYNDVRTALIEWEPRIDVINIDIIPDPSQPTLILISLDYQIRTTNNIFNFVYPFYLQ